MKTNEGFFNRHQQRSMTDCSRPSSKYCSPSSYSLAQGSSGQHSNYYSGSLNKYQPFCKNTQSFRNLHSNSAATHGSKFERCAPTYPVSYPCTQKSKSDYFTGNHFCNSLNPCPCGRYVPDEIYCSDSPHSYYPVSNIYGKDTSLKCPTSYTGDNFHCYKHYSPGACTNFGRRSCEFYPGVQNTYTNPSLLCKYFSEAPKDLKKACLPELWKQLLKDVLDCDASKSEESSSGENKEECDCKDLRSKLRACLTDHSKDDGKAMICLWKLLAARSSRGTEPDLDSEPGKSAENNNKSPSNSDSTDRTSSDSFEDDYDEEWEAREKQFVANEEKSEDESYGKPESEESKNVSGENCSTETEATTTEQPCSTTEHPSTTKATTTEQPTTSEYPSTTKATTTEQPTTTTKYPSTTTEQPTTTTECPSTTTEQPTTTTKYPSTTTEQPTTTTECPSTTTEQPTITTEYPSTTEATTTEQPTTTTEYSTTTEATTTEQPTTSTEYSTTTEATTTEQPTTTTECPSTTEATTTEQPTTTADAEKTYEPPQPDDSSSYASASSWASSSSGSR
ncbi:unnamed protein product [Bemisia tabaci]|uniref:Uncharacterized protein n=1 Tax=Bemisia tabaci TaxID=7038 RepID=A0A9P0A5E4_BEMTA|nr:unnamed protein product [Bemisia tabaci]